MSYLVSCATLTLLLGEARAEGFAQLFRYVPQGANAALFIDAETLQKAALAQEQGWFAPHGDGGRPIYIPAEADRIVVATRVDPSGHLEPQWDVAVVRLKTPIDLAAAAQAEGGYLDSLAGREAVWTPSGAYLIPYEPKTIGEYSPADRQAAARWVSSVSPPATPPDGLTEYLKAASASSGEKTSIVMAFDLADAFPPHVVRAAVMSSQGLKADEKQRKAIADVLTSLRGVTILIDVDDKAHGTIRFDFAAKTDPLIGIEKELMSGILDDAGAALPDLDRWKIHSTARAVTARADVSPAGLRRLLSLIQVPTTKFASLAGAKPAPTEKEIMMEASREYFRTVSTMLDDLRQTLRDTRDNHAIYMERYARKIDRLPILNVDDELLAWGDSVGETLRGQGQDVRGAGLRSGVRKSSMYGAYQYNYDGYGYYYGARSTASAQGQVTREEGASARSSVYGSWKELEDSTADLRRAMTKKYGVEF